MAGYIQVLLRGVAAVTLNQIVSNYVVGRHCSKRVSTLVMNSIRVGIYFFVGRWVISYSAGGLWLASLSGPFLLLVDHVLMKGGYFLICRNRTAFLGVVGSYVLFFWVAMIPAYLGALTASK